ncbi:MAG: thioredoxin family protein [candidate division WOR-3 bacterium]|nr:thioredoxin family protein [candidate division WOR-3 bacterium]
MPILNDAILNQVKKEFEYLTGKVKLIVFTQELECQYCEENRRLMEQIANLSEKISLEIYNFTLDKNIADKYKVDKIPATIVQSDRDDYGIYFYGIPFGYEFTSLIEAIKIVSHRESGLSAESKKILRNVNKPIKIQVFVTLTCPYCAPMVQLAHKVAMESSYITAEMIEASEFPHLAHKYNVYAVPKTVLNDTVQFEGLVPEPVFVEKIKHVLEAE